MVVSRTLRPSSCAACRLSLLRCFTSVSASSFRGQQLSASKQTFASAVQTRRSSNQADSDLHNEFATYEAIKPEPVGEEAESADLQGDAAELSTTESVPWYLQVDPPKSEPRTISERQRIPDLPENPPPLLESLLQQISVDLGVDDLSLLDLRKLDPPPALGANLIMVIGTTRSEKHLHVSADRLCRWLRSTHQLRPDADGLLGRNELKLKLKRKAKRAKLMGSAIDASADDGTRTGWVCVDVGIVDGAEGVPEAVAPKNFVGFGRRSDGVRIVVQMLTEEKREEVDLEDLWSGIIKRGGVVDLEEPFEGEVRERIGSYQSPPEPKIKPIGGSWNTANSPILSQTRGFHTSARRYNEPAPHLELGPDFDFYHKHGFGNLHNMQQTVQDILASGNIEKAQNFVLEQTRHEPSLQNEQWRRFLLSNLRISLESLPRDQAWEMLGEGASDRESTPFLRCFYQTLTSFPSQAEVEAKIWLFCWARSQQHPGYPIASLVKLSKEIQETGVKVGIDPHIDLLEGILRQSPGPTFHYYGPPPDVIGYATEILQAMHDQGLQILDQHVLLRLQKATAPGREENVPAHFIYTDDRDTFNIPSQPMIGLQKRIHLLIVHLRMPLFDEATRLSLMEMYANQQNWLEFWEIWRLAARHGIARSAEFYASMFVLVAATGHQKGCQTVLRNWIPDLKKEAVPVRLVGNVALAVKYCLQIADPNVEEDYLENPSHQGEWVRIWARCEAEGGGDENA